MSLYKQRNLYRKAVTCIIIDQYISPTALNAKQENQRPYLRGTIKCLHLLEASRHGFVYGREHANNPAKFF